LAGGKGREGIEGFERGMGGFIVRRGGKNTGMWIGVE